MACRTQGQGEEASQGSRGSSQQDETKQGSEWGLGLVTWVPPLCQCRWPRERGWAPGKDVPFSCYEKTQGKIKPMLA